MPSDSPTSTSTDSSRKLSIFLSYPSRDQHTVLDLYQDLESRDFDVWMDAKKLKGGDRWTDVTAKALRAADVVIICLSRNYMPMSDYLKDELDTALEIAETLPEGRTFIIPVRLEDCKVPPKIKRYLYLDLFTDKGREQLFAKLDELALLLKSPEHSSHPDTSNTTKEKAATAEARDAQKPPVETASSTHGSGAASKIGSGASGKSTSSEETNQVTPVTDGAIEGGGKGPSGGTSGGTPPAPAPVSKEGLAEEARERRAINDKPITDIKEDTLGFRVYVSALHEFITSRDTTTPLTISINGAWGSGKSSLMKMLERQFKPKDADNLWWIQIKWLAGWLLGTFFRDIGQLLIDRRVADRDYIRLGLAFDPGQDVDKKNFDGLLEKYIEASLKNDIPSDKQSSPERLEEERALRLKKTRFWALHAARRRKMEPRSHPTIWFNAWKFNQQEQVWSALALAVLEQLKTKYGFFTRLRFLVALTFKRTDKPKTLHHILRKLIVPLALAAIVALYESNSVRPYIPAAFVLPENLAWFAPALAAMWQALKAIQDPFKLPIEELVDRPNYEERIGFIGTFEDDFRRIVEVAIRRSIFWQPRKLIIFIDDLDRCSPVQAAGIVEAINLFLDSEGCIFLLGMDVAAVAISIEVKYKDLTERMRKDAPDSISPGVLFLDKIVQIPFNVPRPTKDFINTLVSKITEPETLKPPSVSSGLFKATPSGNGQKPASQPQPQQPKQQQAQPQPVKVDRAAFARDDIRGAILYASQLLKENPRQVKRFINLFRLQVYIAHQRKMLSDNKDYGLTPKRLAVWVAWYMQWPEILKLVSGSAQMEDLSRHIHDICGYVELVEVKDKDDKPVNWRDPQNGMKHYLAVLRTTRKMQESFVSHWSHLPWHLWIKDDDFLCCVKELQVYWASRKLLESMLDMTKVTSNTTPTSASTPTPAVAAINATASATPVPATV